MNAFTPIGLGDRVRGIWDVMFVYVCAMGRNGLYAQMIGLSSNT